MNTNGMWVGIHPEACDFQLLGKNGTAQATSGAWRHWRDGAQALELAGLEDGTGRGHRRLQVVLQALRAPDRKSGNETKKGARLPPGTTGPRCPPPGSPTFLRAWVHGTRGLQAAGRARPAGRGRRRGRSGTVGVHVVGVHGGQVCMGWAYRQVGTDGPLGAEWWCSRITQSSPPA